MKMKFLEFIKFKNRFSMFISLYFFFVQLHFEIYKIKIFLINFIIIFMYNICIL